MNRLEHLLTIAGEEGVEVSHRASKAKRFTLAEIQPGQPLRCACPASGPSDPTSIAMPTSNLTPAPMRAWRAPATHVLKTDPRPFDDVAAGLKTFELRKLDRDYRIGDTLLLLRTSHGAVEMAAGAALDYTGDAVAVLITHIQVGYGLPGDLCGLSVTLQDSAVRAVRDGDMPGPLRDRLVERRRILEQLRVPSRRWAGHQFVAVAELLAQMSQAEVAAAQRFHDTTHDDGNYDLPKAMRTRLSDLGLIRHAGGTRFAETELMATFIDTVERQEVA